MFRSLNDYNFFNKKVLVRCDFNVAIERGKVVDDFKIKRAQKTIEYLKESGAKIILASHLEKDNFFDRASLRPVSVVLEKLFSEKTLFSPKCIGKKAKRMAENLKPGQILLLENLRFNKGEKKNSEKFAKELAGLAEIYVGEAFSCCHRDHASIVSCPKLLPHFIGLECEREISVLSSLMEKPERPLVVLVGGAKVEAKLKMIKKFLPLADHLLFGGKIANVLLSVKGIVVENSEISSQTKRILSQINLTDPKIHLPLDVLASLGGKNDNVRQVALGGIRKEEEIFDIGEATQEKFSEILKTAKTIFWSGDLGLVENPKFRNGTSEIVKAIGKNKSALRVAGGGDTVAFIRSEGMEGDFSFLSIGGSALLEFIANGTLPGVEALKI
ncbi:MAG: phosphoglycerate kinase [Candidatus Pacebacteria bacterium]|nr:phosphoglycerate kinase [Candidatus Paceibacterota bacterium]